MRVAAELQRVLNDLLLNDIKDPRLEGVSVSAVEISGDVSVAKVFFSTLLPDADPAPVTAALEKAGGYLDIRLGDRADTAPPFEEQVAVLHDLLHLVVELHVVGGDEEGGNDAI